MSFGARLQARLNAFGGIFSASLRKTSLDVALLRLRSVLRKSAQKSPRQNRSAAPARGQGVNVLNDSVFCAQKTPRQNRSAAPARGQGDVF